MFEQINKWLKSCQILNAYRQKFDFKIGRYIQFVSSSF